MGRISIACIIGRISSFVAVSRFGSKWRPEVYPHRPGRLSAASKARPFAINNKGQIVGDYLWTFKAT